VAEQGLLRKQAPKSRQEQGLQQKSQEATEEQFKCLQQHGKSWVWQQAEETQPPKEPQLMPVAIVAFL